MQLHLQVGFSDEDELVFDDVLASFDEQEKIGLRIGRAVRDWLRRIPHRRQPTRAHVYLDAVWTEADPRAPRKGKKGKKAAAEDHDAG